MGRRASLTIVVVLFCLGAAACTRRNEGYCCTSAELCADVGGVVQQCPSGQLCDDDGSLADGAAHTCIPDPMAVDCETAEDCDPPTACVNEICVECDEDEDCGTAAAPVCDLDLNRCGDCTSNPQCERFGGVCGPEGNCVECPPGAVPAQAAECPTERPVCETNGVCRTCADHRECTSGACDLTAGTCVPVSEIAYVDATASDANTTCTETSKCRTIQRGLAAGGGTRRYVVIAAGAYMEDVAISDRTVTLVGYGAQLRALTNGAAAVSVGGATGAVEVVGMELRQSATGLDCAGDVGSTVIAALADVTVTTHTAIGVSAFRCDLIMHRTRVTASSGGGVSLTSAGFDIVNSIIDNNGIAGDFGGISITIPQSEPRRIMFTTVVDNQVGTGVNAGGIHCMAASAMPAFRNNLITGNEDPGGIGQVSGVPNCSYEYSLINPELEGTGNTSGDPDFVGSDYRIGPDSAAIDGAADGSGVEDDIDGEDRPSTGADIGADEYHPPS